jgi:hypothetical protein
VHQGVVRIAKRTRKNQEKQNVKAGLDLRQRSLKLRVIFHLIIDPIRRDGVIRNILQIRVPEVQNRIIHRSSDAPDDRMLLSLDLEELIQESLVVRMQFAKVVEDISDEHVQPVSRDDGWVHRT